MRHLSVFGDTLTQALRGGFMGALARCRRSVGSVSCPAIPLGSRTGEIRSFLLSLGEFTVQEAYSRVLIKFGHVACCPQEVCSVEHHGVGVPHYRHLVRYAIWFLTNRGLIERVGRGRYRSRR